MAVTAQEYTQQIKQMLPPGLAWNADDTAPCMALMLECWAMEFSRIDGRVEALINEVDPRLCIETFQEWLTQWGVPDECLKAWGTVLMDELSPQMLRQALVQKVTTIGSQSIRFFVEMAKSYGYSIYIDECRPFMTTSTVMDALYSTSSWYHHWHVKIFTGQAGKVFYHNTLGDVKEPLSWWGDKIIECLLRRYAPAHTVLQIGYIQG